MVHHKDQSHERGQSAPQPHGLTPRLKEALEPEYLIEGYYQDGVLGAGWIGVHARTRRSIFIRVLERALGRLSEPIRHPAIVHVRDIRHLPSVGTIFVFDDVGIETTTLRQVMEAHPVSEAPNEEAVGDVFTPIVLGLLGLEEAGLLPPAPLVDLSTVLSFPDGTTKIMCPLQDTHFDDTHHLKHDHRPLMRRWKDAQRKNDKIIKRWAKRNEPSTTVTYDGDGRPILDEDLHLFQRELSQRFITADLALILYQLMTGHHVTAITRAMVSHAKRMHRHTVRGARRTAKRARQGKPHEPWREPLFSPGLTGLLVELLRSGRTIKYPIISLSSICGAPVMQRFIRAFRGRIEGNRMINQSDRDAYSLLLQNKLQEFNAPPPPGPELARGDDRDHDVVVGRAMEKPTDYNRSTGYQQQPRQYDQDRDYDHGRYGSGYGRQSFDQPTGSTFNDQGRSSERQSGSAFDDQGRYGERSGSAFNDQGRYGERQSGSAFNDQGRYDSGYGRQSFDQPTGSAFNDQGRYGARQSGSAFNDQGRYGERQSGSAFNDGGRYGGGSSWQDERQRGKTTQDDQRYASRGSYRDQPAYADTFQDRFAGGGGNSGPSHRDEGSSRPSGQAKIAQMVGGMSKRHSSAY